MESYPITKTPTGIHIQGFPNAVKVIKIKGSKAQRLSDLALHKSDLTFAKECCAILSNIADHSERDTLSESLWRTSIISYIKCFGDHVSRFSLNYKKIYSEELPRELHLQFKNLRNKHFIHDENSYSQSVVGAVLNQPKEPYKIAKIVNVNIFAGTLSKDTHNNLKLLIEDALKWVIAQYDSLCNDLTKEYEQFEYDELLALEQLDYILPFNDAIFESRKKIK